MLRRIIRPPRVTNPARLTPEAAADAAAELIAAASALIATIREALPDARQPDGLSARRNQHRAKCRTAIVEYSHTLSDVLVETQHLLPTLQPPGRLPTLAEHDRNAASLGTPTPIGTVVRSYEDGRYGNLAGIGPDGNWWIRWQPGTLTGCNQSSDTTPATTEHPTSFRVMSSEVPS